MPGFGSVHRSPADFLSMESYSSSASRLAADLSCDVVVGHSLGANVALEMVSAGEFSGHVVLLSPSFSRKDESIFPRALDRLSRVFGHLPYALMMKLIGQAGGACLPARRPFLVNKLRKNDLHASSALDARYPAFILSTATHPRRARFCRFRRPSLGCLR